MKKISRREAIRKGGRMVLGVAGGLSASALISGCSEDVTAKTIGEDAMKNIKPAKLENIKITIVYDNNAHNEGLELDWGFSCVVEGLEKTILFDTGRFDSLFMTNMEKLGINPESIETVILSHEHPDHVGGLFKFLDINPKVHVYLPESFSNGYKKDAADCGAGVIEVEAPMLIDKSCLSSGQMKNFVKNEHSLFISTSKGLLVITGCAHPGIIDIVKRAKTLTDQEILFVLGGFHLLHDSSGKIRNIAAKMSDLGVKCTAPTHCSGPNARKIFSETPAIKYVDCGVGRIIEGRELI